MLAGLSVPPDLLVDRYYRGAIVMVGQAMFAIAEPAIRLIERARDAGPATSTTSEDDALVAALIAQGLLIRTA